MKVMSSSPRLATLAKLPHQAELLELQLIYLIYSGSPETCPVQDFSSLEEVMGSRLNKILARSVRVCQGLPIGTLFDVFKENREEDDPDISSVDEMRALMSKAEASVGSVSAYDVYKFLIELYAKRSSIPLIEEYVTKIMTGKLQVTEGFRLMADEAENRFSEDDSKFDVVTTDNWEQLFAEEQVRARERARHPLTFSDRVPLLRQNFPSIVPGLIGIVSDTGVGKTSFVMGEAFSWAEVGGYNVLYGSTEANASKVQNRYATMKRVATYSQLQSGLDTPEIRNVMKPFASGGKVHIVKAPGMSLKRILRYAERIDAHLALDVFQDLDLSDYSKRSSNETYTLLYAMQALVDWLERNQKVALASFQITIDARREVRQTGRRITLADISGGQAAESKMSTGLVMDFPMIRNEITITDPFMTDSKGKKMLFTMYPGNLSNLGMMTIGKGRYRKEDISGEHIPGQQIVWRHRGAYEISGIPISTPDGQILSKVLQNEIYGNGRR